MEKGGVPENIRKSLAKDHACFVLITCSEPSEDGHMEVQLNYEGDPTLAAYLLQSAQAYLDRDQDDILGDTLAGEYQNIN